MSAAGGGTPSYGVKYQSRCIASQLGEKERTRFLIGTLSLREENEIHHIQYSEGVNEIVSEGVYHHPHEVWDLACSPFDARLFSTVYRTGEEYGASVWRLLPKGKIPQSAGTAAQGLQLEQVVELKGHSAPIKSVLWCPLSTKQNVLVSLDEETIRVWNLDEGKKAVEARSEAKAGDLQHIAGGCWDPHDSNAIAVASGTLVEIWDLRTMRRGQKVDQAHAMQVRDVDYNPKRQNTLLTTGDDSYIRFWDTRQMATPLLELQGHNHWVWRAKFNRVYDELVLSGGTDSACNLWYVPSISSSKNPNERSGNKGSASELSSMRTPREPLDGLAQAYTEHEDSIYGGSSSAICLRKSCLFTANPSAGFSTYIDACWDQDAGLLDLDFCFAPWSKHENLASFLCKLLSVTKAQPATFLTPFRHLAGVAWSTKDPLLFASLSYDGRVVVDRVPDTVRRKLSKPY